MTYPLVVKRWKFTDLATGNTYIVPMNPNTMTGIFPDKTITVETTTAVDGQVLLFQGATKPTQWQFGGEIFDQAHHEALRHWTYDIHNRIQIEDHFGRPLIVVLENFSAIPKRANGKYWRHTYTIKGLLLSAGAPTVLL